MQNSGCTRKISPGPGRTFEVYVIGFFREGANTKTEGVTYKCFCHAKDDSLVFPVQQSEGFLHN